MHQRDERGPMEPHPVIAGFYAGRAEHRPFVRGLFNDTAPYYDRINWLFSLGTGARYRRQCLLAAGLRQGMRVIDVAVGTGLLAREAAAVTGNRQEVIGIDLSETMLAIARSKLNIPLVQGLAERLPFAEASADFVTMGYALRHVSNLADVFQEFHRVLRPSGIVLVLEIGRPTKRLSRVMTSAYLGKVVPFLCGMANGRARTSALMRYYWETIENCVPPDVILEAMRVGGFTEPRCQTELDIFRSYVARKP